LPPKVAVKATRFGTTGLATASVNDRPGASKVSGSREHKPAMVSRNSATSATVRAIGPCTDSGAKRLLDVPRVTRPADGRRPTTEQ
jgi:hypothetical protein